jgi:amino acid transporter
MFFGDLGTSRLYVLGLALFYAGTAAPFYVAAICALVLLVGWGYTVVCRVNPDGGGVYSSGRMLHPTLGVVGALLLFANYVVTAAISTYEAIIYIGGPFGMVRELAPWLSVLAIALLGLLNCVGSKRAGAFALLVAISAVAITAILASLTITHVPTGWGAITPPAQSPWNIWLTFVAVVLALSGVESIANMTGIMVEPVKRTSKLSIWPVVGEVVLLNLILVLVVVSLPELRDLGVIADKAKAGLEISAYEHALKDQVLYVVAERHVGHTFATIASIIFGLLLLSATNTAIVAMISIQYAMSRDRELPRFFSRINSYGVPWCGLIGACALPAIVCALARDVQTLAQLYAIGVVGAIAINLGSCAYNRALKIAKSERVWMWALAVFMGLIWLTVAVTNLWATLFLTVILSGGMCLRYAAKWLAARVPAVPVPAPAEVAIEAEAPLLPFDPSKSRILVATRGNLELLRFAFKEARQHAANLFVLFVRDINVLFPGRERPLSPEEDAEAASLFQAARDLAREHSVPLQDIYCVGPDPADVILDFAATYAADMVILGVSRRAGVLRALRGDVISGVADNLPAESTLLIHA